MALGDCGDPKCLGWGVFNGREIQRCDECKIFETDEDAARHVQMLNEEAGEELEVPEWLGANFTTGDMWCRKCQTSIKMPAGSLKDAMWHLGEFVRAHRKCVWDRWVMELIAHAQHMPDCRVHQAGAGCTCFLNALLGKVGATEEQIKEKNKLHSMHMDHMNDSMELKMSEPRARARVGDYKGRLRHG